MPFLLLVSGNVNGLCNHLRNVFYVYDFLDFFNWKCLYLANRKVSLGR